MVLRRLLVVLMILGGRAHSQPAPDPGPEQAISQKIAVWRFDALGIEGELVNRLETLFRLELERLVKQPLPTRSDINRVTTIAERECTGEEKCLATIGKKLGVEVVVTGTVGSLGDAYILNIKAIDTATARTLQRIQTDPLRGGPDDLIEGVRVAAYRLLAPTQLHGALQIQSDLVGAAVELDGKAVGKTPLANLGVISKQTLGPHKLKVSAPGYAPFEETVDVRFQKVSQVVVRLIASEVVLGSGTTTRVERQPFYSRTWFIVTAVVGAVVLGGVIGAQLGKVDCIDGVTGAKC